MIINCHTDNNPFIDQPMPKVSLKVGLEIAEQLFAELEKPENLGSNGIGLAANQVGIEAAVAVINVIEPFILINPTIVDVWGKIPFKGEGCLSYPGAWINTVRYKNIIRQLEIYLLEINNDFRFDIGYIHGYHNPVLYHH